MHFVEPKDRSRLDARRAASLSPFSTYALLRVDLLVVCILLLPVCPLQGQSQQTSTATGTNSQSNAHDGQHDFDFAIGEWKTHLSRLQHPLTGSTTWVEYEGSSVVRKVWDGRASLEEFEANGAAGHIEGLTLCLYNPEVQQWNQSWSTSNDGTLSQPMVGRFKGGRGEFFDQEAFHGRMIYVRWVWSDITPDSCRFEQAFSGDGGKTWEVNWINVYTRRKDASENTH